MTLEYLLIIIKSVISLPFLFFIPGFLVNSIYLQNKSSKFDSFLIFHIFVSIIITSFIALILAQSGLFSLFGLVILLFLASIILYYKYKKLPERTKFSYCIVFDAKNILITLLIISSILLFFHPFPWLAGGLDPGTYVSTGVHIAKSGSIFVKDPLIAQMNTTIQETLYDVDPASIYGFISWANVNFKFQMLGFFITDLSSGTITPQFLQIFPVWMAIFYSIFGLAGVFFVNPVFGTLSIISLYLLAKRLFSWKVGILAGFILVLSFSQIWYARYPFAEMMTQFFILSGLATFIYFNITSDKYLAVISAFLFGLSFLTKLDGLFILFPLSIYYIYKILNKRCSTSDKYFFGSIFILLIYTLIDYIIYNKSYIEFIIHFAIDSPPSQLLDAGKNIIFSNIHMLFWYETKLGVLLAFTGLGIILLKREKKEKLLLVFIALMFSLIYLSKLSVTNLPPWWARRFVPITFPLYALFAGYGIYEIANIKKIGSYISCILIVSLMASLAFTSNLIINHSEGEGMVEGISELSKYFNDTDVILMSSSFEGVQISLPLYYIYEKKVIYLNKYVLNPSLGTIELPAPENVSTGIDYLLDKGYNVYLVFGPENIYMEKIIFNLATNHKIDFVISHEFSYKHLDSNSDLLPNTIVDVPMRSDIYRVSLPISNISGDSKRTIDIGSPLDVLYLEYGFHLRETLGETTFRWTSSNASVRLYTPEKNNFTLHISAGGFRPKDVPSANVNIYLNEHLIGNFTTFEEYKLYNMTLNNNYLTSPYSTLRISSSTFKPSEYFGTIDTRDLGVRIDNISIEETK